MRLFIFNGVLLALVGAWVFGTHLLDRADSAVEASVRQYASAVSNSDLQAALAEIAPSQRPRWVSWVRGQLGNVYEVRGIAVRSPSPLRRITTTADGPFEVTIVLDINRGFAGEFYQPTPHVSVEQVDGRWYLSAPPLATE